MPYTFRCTLLIFAALVSSHAHAKAWTYDFKYDGNRREFAVEAMLPAKAKLLSDRDSVGFIKNVSIDAKSLGSASSSSLPIILPACPSGFCRVNYVFELGKAAASIKDGDKINSIGAIILSNPSLWLLRPENSSGEQSVEFRIEVINSGKDPQNKIVLTTGMFTSAADPQVTITTADHLEDLPWTLVGPYRKHSYRVQGATVDLAIIPEAYKVKDAQIIAWCQRATTAVTSYYGSFPVPHVLVIVVPQNHYQGPGKSFGNGGAVTINPLSLKADEASLHKDWVMTHEMVHLALPSLPYRQHWLEEGLASYIEPIARVQSGELTPETVFKDMMAGMPQGVPKAGDGGLDGPESWGKTYWGGAVFAFLADKELRIKSKGKVGIQGALRGILVAGGSMASSWPMEKTLMIADKATGYTVLTDLYQAMKDKSPAVNLSGIWQQLGVKRAADGTLSFDDNAPLAYVRLGILGKK